MGSSYSGRNISLQIGKEAVAFGTVAASFAGIKQTGFSGGLRPEYIQSESRVGSRAPDGSYKVAQLGSLTVPFEASPEDLGYFLKGVLGTEVSALAGSTDAYTHTFTMGTSLDSWSLRRGYAGVSCLDALGAVLNELSLEFALKALVTGSATYSYADEASGTLGSPSFTDLRPFVFSDISVKIDSSSFGQAKTAGISITNNLKTDDYRLDGTGEVSGFDPQEFGCSFNLGVVYNSDSTALWGKVSSGDSVAVEITLDTGIVIESGYNYELVITMPNVQFTEGDIDTAVDGMMIPLVGTAFLGTSDESPITFVLQNERTTAY